MKLTPELKRAAFLQLLKNEHIPAPKLEHVFCKERKFAADYFWDINGVKLMLELQGGVDGVKIHLLHILKYSPLGNLYNEGKVKLLEQDEYVGLVCDFLEHLSPGIVIQRLTGEGDRNNHVAPQWALDKSGTINKIRETLNKRGSRQGYHTKAADETLDP